MKNYKLEFVRGFAAILVFFNHFIGSHPALKNNNSLIKNFFGNWGVEAVIIFFILSGIVINLSQKSNPKPACRFIKDRVLRIYPLFIVGMLLGITVLILLKESLPSVKQLLGDFLMLSTLQSYIISSIKTNDPIWTLTFEMSFYAIFTLVLLFNKSRNIFITWIAAALICVIFYFKFYFIGGVFSQISVILAFSLIWLWGYFLYEIRNKFSVDVFSALFSAGFIPIVSRFHFMNEYYDVYKFLLLAILSSPFFIYLIGDQLQTKKIRIINLLPVYIFLIILLFLNSQSLFISKCLYVSLPIFFLLLAYLIKRIFSYKNYKEYYNRFSLVIGKYSFALYILHYPIVYYWGNKVNSFTLYVVISVINIGIFVFISEKYFQPFIVKLFRQNRPIQKLSAK